jgi:hypothetical protein
VRAHNKDPGQSGVVFPYFSPTRFGPARAFTRAADDLGMNFGRIAGGTSWPPSKPKFAAFAFHEVE